MTRRPVRAALGVAVAASGMALAIASPAFAADGDIDPTYGDPTGTPGTVSTTFSSSAVPQALAMQFDSKIVVTGGVGTSFGTARYYNDGDLDGNWGAGNGRVTTAVGATGSPSGAFAVAIQPLDDKVVVAGYAGNPSNGANRDFAVVRYTPSGALDTSFDTDGTTTVDFRPVDTATGIALQADGKIVVAGTATDPNSPSSGTSVMAVIRLNADGTLDSSFDADGKVTIGTGGNGVSGEGVVVQADGKIVVVGTSNGATIALARLNPNGTQDNTFDADGIVLTDISTVIGLPGSLAQASGLALDNDGRILVSGRQSLSSGEAQTLAARYTPDGILDGTFGVGGIALADLALANEGANDVALQHDGKVVVTGFAGNDVSVIRFTTAGGLDGTFDTDGFVIRPVGIGDDVGNDVVIQADGKVLVAASGTIQTNEGGNAAFNTVRFLGSSPGIRPPAPPNVVATPGDTWALVCWEPPPTTGATILAYTVSQFPGGGFQTVPATQRCVPFTGLTNGVAYTFSVSARTQLAAGPPGTSTATPNANAAPLGAASFVPLPPTRVLDTRDGTGAAAGKVPRDGSIELTVRGRGGVPDETNVTAVVLNVTATESGGAGFVTAYPTGEPTRPNVSNLNVSGANQTIPNLVTVKLGAGGKVTLYAFDTTHLIADVVGYHVSSTGATSGRFNPLAPARILDTRDGNGVASPGKVPPGGELQLQVTGRGGVPASGVSAVIMNVTSTEASAPGYVTVYPSGVPRPYGSNLNAETTNQTRPNLVVVPVSATGQVTMFSLSGTHLIADVAGWFTDASAAPAVSGLFVPTVPTRILDTRDGTGRPGRAKVAADASIDIQVSGLGGVSATRSAAVVANLTATEATNPGFITAYPTGIAQPTVSNVNVEARNQTIPNAVTVRIGSGGKVTLYTQSGTHLAFDTFGWYVG